MRTNWIRHLPLFFLLLMSAGWSFYYLSSNSLNGYGTIKPEWLLLLDMLVTLPLVCFLCIKDKKQAAIQCVVYICLLILLGSFIIPAAEQHLWNYLEYLRYLFVIAFIGIEFAAISTVIRSLAHSLNQHQDHDLATTSIVERTFGRTPLSRWIAFEVRVWSYAWFAHKINPADFNGEQHFSYHRKDGAASNLFGFILVMLFETPLMHLLLHFIWSPLAANIVTFLTLFSMVFFVAEYRAMQRRPISVDQQQLSIRYGVWPAMYLPLDNIQHIQVNKPEVEKRKSRKIFNVFGVPNVKIVLRQPVGEVSEVYLGVDAPTQLVAAVQQRSTGSR